MGRVDVHGGRLRISFVLVKAINQVVSAQVLMGFDVDFLEQDLVVTAPFEAFPTMEFVVVNSKLGRALTLPRFFKSQPLHTVSLDIGVFDRVVHGQPDYVSSWAGPGSRIALYL
jgi:hypothetical protein